MSEDIKELFEDMNGLLNPEKQRVVCAANRFPDGTIIIGVRHFCPFMIQQLKALGVEPGAKCDQGFIDQWGNFLTRQEAYVIAERQGQYRPWGHHAPGTLYSEDLY